MAIESRREFLKCLGFLGGTLLVENTFAGKLASGPEVEVLLITNSTKAGYGKPWMTVKTPPGTVRIFTPRSGKIDEVPLPFFGHTLAQNPHQLNLVATFEQFGRRGAIVDLKARRALVEVETSESNTFLGHSAYSPDKKWIFTTEHNHRKDAGEISIRDAANLKFIQSFPSFGMRPHDCRLIDNGTKLIVANNLGPSSISYIETASGKLLHQVKMEADKRLVLSHFDISKDQWLFAGPRDKSPYGVLVSPEGKLHKLPHPAIEETGMLSVAFINDSEFLAATYPEGDRVQIWNYKTQESVASFRLPNPRGILSASKTGGTDLIVSLAMERTLRSLTFSKSRSLAAEPFVPGFGGSGSHLVRLSFT